MPIDPSTGLWVPEAPSPNPGAFAGASEILNSSRGAELAQRSDYESLLAEHMKELQLQEAQNKMSRQVGYQGAMQGLSDEYNQSVTSGHPMSPSDISTEAIIKGLPYGEPGGAQSLGMAAAFGPKSTTAGAAVTRANAAESMAKARMAWANASQTGQNAKMLGVISGMDPNMGQALRMMKANGIPTGLSDEEYSSVMSDPDASAQPFDPAAHQKVISAQNKDSAMKVTADARMVSARAQATIASAREQVLKNAPTKDTAIRSAERSVDSLEKTIMAKEKDLGTLGTAAGMSDDLKAQLKEQIDGLKSDLVIRRKDLDDLRQLRMMQSTNAAGGGGVKTVVPPGQATASDLWKKKLASGALGPIQAPTPPPVATPPTPAVPGT